MQALFFLAYPEVKALNIFYLLGDDMIPIVICFKYCYSLKVIAVIAIAFLLIQNAFIAFISLNVNRSL